MSTDPERPPARPDAPAGRDRPGRRWRPVGVVVAVLVVTVLGGFVTAAALPEPHVRALAVGGVTVHAAPGWAVVTEERVALPGPTGGSLSGSFAQLSRGSGTLDVLAIEGLEADLEGASEYYADGVLRRQLQRLTVSGLGHIVLGSGLPAARFAYVGTEPETGAAVEGSVTLVVGSQGTVAVFDGWGSQGQLELIAEELSRMIDSAEVD